MRLKTLIFFTIFGLVFFSAQPLFSKTGDYGLPGAFLSWGASARSLGMGKTFVGLADDASAVYYNPAGLNQLYFNQLVVFHAVLFEDTSFSFASFGCPVSHKLAFGAGAALLRSGGYEYRDAFGAAGGEFGTQDLAWIFSGAYRLYPKLSLGSSVKIIRQKVHEYEGSGTGVDLSLLYSPYSWLSGGLVVQNVVPPKLTLYQDEETYPLKALSGIAVKLLDDKLNLLFDFRKIKNQDLKFSSGAEYWLHPLMGIRGGWNETELACGFGFRAMQDFVVDYAFANQDLGNSHRFSITYTFGGFKSKVKAEPKAFSPLGSSPNKFVTLKLKGYAKYGVKKWELTIRNDKGEIVKVFFGAKIPPDEVVWDGRSDKDNQRVPDGKYRATLLLTDVNDEKWQSSQETFEIITKIPEFDISIDIGK